MKTIRIFTAFFFAFQGSHAAIANQKASPPPVTKPHQSTPIKLDDLKPRYTPSVPKDNMPPPLAPAPPSRPKPEVSIGHGTSYGVSPTVTFPTPNGGRVEFKGPDIHPQVPPRFDSGSIQYTGPMPEGKKR